jgi:hypothetical protein
MRLTIKAKKEIETLTGTEKPVFKFWAPDNGGYVRLESDGKSGTLGQQICDGGGFSGSTVSCSPANFDRVCRSWYRAYMRVATKKPRW